MRIEIPNITIPNVVSNQQWLNSNLMFQVIIHQLQHNIGNPIINMPGCVKAQG